MPLNLQTSALAASAGPQLRLRAFQDVLVEHLVELLTRIRAFKMELVVVFALVVPG
jgi:hypothetical protein